MSTASYDHDSKYNVVLYGVEECRRGLSRSARLESDLSSVVNVFSALDSSIQSHSVRDCFRLGKFSPDATRPRPILVKFVRVADVSKIFSKKVNYPPLSLSSQISLASNAFYSLFSCKKGGS